MAPYLPPKQPRLQKILDAFSLGNTDLTSCNSCSANFYSQWRGITDEDPNTNEGINTFSPRPMSTAPSTNTFVDFPERETLVGTFADCLEEERSMKRSSRIVVQCTMEVWMGEETWCEHPYRNASTGAGCRPAGKNRAGDRNGNHVSRHDRAQPPTSAGC